LDASDDGHGNQDLHGLDPEVIAQETRDEGLAQPSPGRPIAKKTAKARTKTVASQLLPPSATETAAAKKKFEQGIITRGEAVPAGDPLPAGATHEIVGTARDGSPILKRKRFSMT
jgi:hypothetical protein